MAPTGDDDAGTLADASEKIVKKLLNRVSGKRKGESTSDGLRTAKRCIWNSSLKKSVGESSSVAVCGAPAAQSQQYDLFEKLPQSGEAQQSSQKNSVGESSSVSVPAAQSNKQYEQSEKLPQQSAKLPQQSGKLPQQSGNLPQQSEKLPPQSGKLPQQSGIPQQSPQQSEKPSQQSGKLPQQSGKLPQQSVKEEDEIVWEDGEGTSEWDGEVTIEVEGNTPNKKQPLKRTVRRATAKDKEFAELIHKSHLLCLVARGRIVDAACDDQLLQASILSLVPPRLQQFSSLKPYMKWLGSVIRVITNEESRKCSVEGESFVARLHRVLAKQCATEEELSAVSVAMFRALGFSTRYVAVLDVASLKPDAESLEASKGWEENIPFNRNILSPANIRLVVDSSTSLPHEEKNEKTEEKNEKIEERDEKREKRNEKKEERNEKREERNVKREERNEVEEEEEESKGRGKGKRKEVKGKEEELKGKMKKKVKGGASTQKKGDTEFELQMAMAMEATKMSQAKSSSSRSNVTAGATTAATAATNAAQWSRKKGPILHWAEVRTEEKWFHVDVVRDILDDTDKVESTFGGKTGTPLRYVVAFASSGAKDITPRYVCAWSKLSGLRVDEGWWKSSLLPLTQLLEYGANNSEEDMELQTKSLAEPLPTNQQAYKNHHLYVMERWVKRFEVLHPEGPILGYCAGKPVYPRSSLQPLHTADRWLREGFSVKPHQQPAKVIKSRSKRSGDGDDVADCLLYGLWQTEPYVPPLAVDGIVPRNERGQVDVWSEKCLPRGTVHLRLPRLVPIAQRLGVNFAPAMVGFEVRQGRSVPVYEGIVVCEEFKDGIMEAYAEEEERRKSEMRKRREECACRRWRLLLNSIATRQRLREEYQGSTDLGATATATSLQQPQLVLQLPQRQTQTRVDEEHVHVFDECTEEESSRRCSCGFSVHVEEM